MATFYREDVQRGADYILAHLAEHPTFVYSEHLDFRDVDMPQLCAKLDIDLNEFRYRGSPAPDMCLQFAADQLAESGIVRLRFLPFELPFDEKEFEVDLTPAGVECLKSGGVFRCVDLDL